ncbi:PepSY domain-containing protein [Clostridium sp. MD294]|uniref:PepSY domain-containing protein n=1 Tax=Clostridium sp. MD294 TaxID=97138 RepID=UPI0002CC9B6B|nr:PepSY domain-containing protein [Clostridium sp. MD294]NDO45515.1 hypothetical protein [Clostridium sp. MD294]USF30833.1 hypothetical protein C820_002277 [Clostridium sp. MD294]
MNFGKKFIAVLTAGAILTMGTTQIFAAVLTSEQAKSIALAYVPEESIHINTKEEYNKFEIKLYNQKDQTAYEIDIDKTTQKPISFESKSQCHIGGIQVVLSEEQAKNIVLQEIPQAQFISSYLEWDDGMQEYKISFYTPNIQGKYQINAQNGMIVEREIKFIENQTTIIPQTPPTINTVTQNTVKSPQTILTVEQAKQIAQSKAPNAVLYEIKLDNDDGRMIYEGEMKQGHIEYEFEIDATTGVIIEWDIDIDD